MNTKDRSGQTPTRDGWVQYPLNHGGDHFADLHRDNSQGSQHAITPERAPDPANG